ncbi:MAG TPA: alpha-ketoglutarate-dependent dioxygenase AlkB [Burkholderiales bacterium]|nr:alpha-ketoglutarate-dependent dioxygenase AlkB [Burkholderiales bacterium]
MASAQQAQLFDAASRLPEGFIYQRDFLTAEEEAALLTEVRALPLAEAKYKEYTARRRTASYGGQYDYTLHKLEAAPTFPEFLLRLREKVGGWVGIPAEKFVHGLVSEYRAGTPLGWHRDVPNFETIVGISLAGNARMRLRPYRPGEKQRREDVIALELEPRSAYIIRGSARWGWQHSVSPTKELRYSITFRTARGNA